MVDVAGVGKASNARCQRPCPARRLHGLLSREEPVQAREPRTFLTTVAQRVLANHCRRQQLERIYLPSIARAHAGREPAGSMVPAPLRTATRRGPPALVSMAS